MGIKNYRPTSAGRRQMSVSDFTEVTRGEPERSLLRGRSRQSGGRNVDGHVTSWHRGGGHKRRYRVIDFRRDKTGIPAKVASIEYDPNRSANIALLHYKDGDKRYILAPDGLKAGDVVLSSKNADIKPGNALALRYIPIGTSIHNVELKIGGGGQLARTAGVGAQLMAKEGDWGQVRLPSGEVRKVHLNCRATIGLVGNGDHANMFVGKAGRKRWLGKMPHNRRVVMNPVDHPMGGGEGKSSGGR